MKIDEESCVGCSLCMPYCPMDAIAVDRAAKVARINSDECAWRPRASMKVVP